MRVVSFLIKPASSLCNLRCKYCFYEDEADNRTDRSMGVMTETTADILIHEAYELVSPGGMVSYAFQGGEPTVAGLPFFEHFVSIARQNCPENVSLQFSIQTNGLLLDEAWAEFLKRENFLVGISLDGYKLNHDRHRVDTQGLGTWKRAAKTAEMLQKHGVDTNVLCVVTGQLAKQPELAYKELKNLGFDYLQFIACLDPLGEERGKQEFSLLPEAYGDFLCRLFDLWYKDWKMGKYHSIRLFDDYIHILLGDHASTCATCGNCGSYFVVEGDGSVYPCDFFVLDEWRMGKLGEQSLKEMAEGEKQAEFLKWGREKPEDCRSCRWSKVCNGGCKRDWVETPSGVKNYYCIAFKKLLDHAMPGMQEIVRAELMVSGMR
ncbi:anaerobic sulfatase-maturating enzyme [Lachnospiraceae bacterium JC7]|nr:anaerobic sulfatase-maturating enzyme [Lachnospiraceae bacterium JC7]